MARQKPAKLLGNVGFRASASGEALRRAIGRVGFDELPPETAVKLQSLELNEDYQSLCRNLSLFIRRAIPEA